MQGVVTWFIDKLLATFQAWVHPEQAAQWEAIKQRGKDLDAAHVELDRAEAAFQVRLTESAQRQAAWQTKIEEADAAIAAEAERRKQIADDLAKTESAIDARPDTDRIEQPLPGTGSDRR